MEHAVRERLTLMILSERCLLRMRLRPSRKRMKPSSRTQSPLPPIPEPAPSPYTSQCPSPSATRLAPPAGSRRKRVLQNFRESIRLWRQERSTVRKRTRLHPLQNSGILFLSADIQKWLWSNIFGLNLNKEMFVVLKTLLSCSEHIKRKKQKKIDTGVYVVLF